MKQGMKSVMVISKRARAVARPSMRPCPAILAGRSLRRSFALFLCAMPGILHLECLSHRSGGARARKFPIAFSLFQFDPVADPASGGLMDDEAAFFADWQNHLAEALEEIGRWHMPFGKYGPKNYPPNGVPLYDLPDEYVIWFQHNGFPKGRLG